MSEAIIFENMPYNLFLKQRMEFVVICGDHLAANVMRVVEADMIKRKEAWQVRVEKAIEEKKPLPKEPKTWWVRLSQAQIIARLYMYDSAKLKKPESEDLNSPEWVEYRFKRALSISKATLKKAIELLKALGFLIERSKPGDEFGAPIYTLDKENVQNAIKRLPANPFAIFHALGGVENFDSGGDSKNFHVPPKNSDSGESKILTVPPQEFSPGESQNFHVDIDITIDPPEDSEIDTEEESTCSEQSEPAITDAIASTRAPVSQDEPYRPDFSANQDRPTTEVAEPAYHSDGNDGHTCYEAEPAPELSTSIPQSGKVSHARSSKPSSEEKKPKPRYIPPTAQVIKPQLTLLGGQVREWYETIRACRLRMTEKNVNALNILGELDGMDFVNLKETIELIEEQNMVKERNIPIDPQALAKEDGYWSFDKWCPVVVRNRQKQTSKAATSASPPPTSASLPSYSHMSDEEYRAFLRKGTQNARTTYAR